MWLYSTGARVTPICLPQPDLKIPPWTNCAIAGWGKTKESLYLFSIKCFDVMQSLENVQFFIFSYHKTDILY